MRQEVITDKEAHEDKIINNAFKIDLKREIRKPHLILQVFAKSPNVHELQTKTSYHKQLYFIHTR